MIFLLIFPWLLVAVAVASVAGRTVRFRDLQTSGTHCSGCGRWISSGASPLCDACIDGGR